MIATNKLSEIEDLIVEETASKTEEIVREHKVLKLLIVTFLDWECGSLNKNCVIL